MPVLYGLYMDAELENVSSVRFTEASTWNLVVQKAGSSDLAEQESVALPSYQAACLEWKGVRGVDRIACDRNAREARISLVGNLRRVGSKRLGLRKQSLGEYTNKGEHLSLVAVFSCEGCEPVEWTGSGDIVIEDDEGNTLEGVDFEYGIWHDGLRGVATIHHEFRRI
mmetsp:Transcript_96792/g.242806  ORF Transcript_96792/g.242806 Transcript_96792/m.242806 type:complete len:168 (+) Transcript_96792:84-587(+)